MKGGERADVIDRNHDLLSSISKYITSHTLKDKFSVPLSGKC